jgi:CxxC-x17-CxxC domain-containing protein
MTDALPANMDKTLACRDCGQEFTFTSGEQDFYVSKGFTNEPTRCPSCRSSRKREREGGYVGGTYTSGTSGGERRERQMFAVVCDECGKQTEVPFQPRGDRPVYCSDCFRAKQSSVSTTETRERRP